MADQVIHSLISYLNDKITTKKLNITATPAEGVTVRNFDVYQTGDVVRVVLYFDTASNISNNGTIVTLSENLPQITGTYAYSTIRTLSGNTSSVSIEQTDRSKIKAWGAITTGTYYYADIMYIIRP